MNRALAMAFLLSLLPSPVGSQTAEGSLAGVVGGWSRGGAPLIGGALCVGVNVTPLTAVEAEGSVHEGLIVGLATGARVRFGRLSKGRRIPFLTAGLTRLTPFIEPSLSGWYVGIGIDLGTHEHQAVRFEIRDVIPNESGSHVWSVRVGASFR